MAISIDWVSRVVTVPQADLTLVDAGPPPLYSLDTEAFRREVKALEASEEGMPYVRVIDHNPQYTVFGTTYARKVEIVNGYQVEFEDGQYSVVLLGSNNNLGDSQAGVLIRNQVQVIPTNAAGLVVVTDPDTPTSEDIADAVWDEPLAEHATSGTAGRKTNDIWQNQW